MEPGTEACAAETRGASRDHEYSEWPCVLQVRIRGFIVNLHHIRHLAVSEYSTRVAVYCGVAAVVQVKEKSVLSALP